MADLSIHEQTQISPDVTIKELAYKISIKWATIRANRWTRSDYLSFEFSLWELEALDDLLSKLTEEGWQLVPPAVSAPPAQRPPD